jgi:hypothetical protein
MLRIILTLALSVLVVPTAVPAEKLRPGSDFMIVIREVESANKKTFAYTPAGPSTVTLPSGEKVTINNAWFNLIGDMHVRFVVDGKDTMRNLSAKEFADFGLPPESAAQVAVRNIVARYGQPQTTRSEVGVISVFGTSPDLNSSYFLDRAFWNATLRKHPDGLIVAVPARGTLLYAPVSDTKSVTFLKQNIVKIYQSATSLRVSSGLYLYKGGEWLVYQKPFGAK